MRVPAFCVSRFAFCVSVSKTRFENARFDCNAGMDFNGMDVQHIIQKLRCSSEVSPKVPFLESVWIYVFYVLELRFENAVFLRFGLFTFPNCVLFVSTMFFIKRFELRFVLRFKTQRFAFRVSRPLSV